MNRLQERIEEFRTLERGWDGYNGSPPLPEALERAKQIASRLSPCEDWYVFPSPDGGVLFENDMDGVSVSIDVWVDVSE